MATIVADAQNRARDLGNTPANDLPPSRLACVRRGGRGAARPGPHRARRGRDPRSGDGRVRAVAQGSDQSARLIRLDYDGSAAAAGDVPLVALIGKAVTFDSGGISLKPAGTMHEMKFDMCGGAAVIEAIAALAELRAPVRVLGLIGATENLPSGQRGQAGRHRARLDGTTIEVNNTDAEGRLVLADCIAYARREGAERLVDVATLTGGVVVALGSTYAGLMSNDDDWAERVVSRGAAHRRDRMAAAAPRGVRRHDQGPLRADRQLAPRSGQATALTAGEFLHHFAGDVPWAHLDIAGTAYDVRRPYFADKGATGFGVRLLVELARAGAQPSVS